MFPKIILRPKRDQAVRRFHPWVFSGAIKKVIGSPKDGSVVEVFDSKENYLATGHYHKGSIMVRIFSFEKTDGQLDFWTQKIGKAFHFRKQLQLNHSPETNCFRLIHAEGDGCPGLIVDIYNSTAVIQCHSIGMHLEREKITEAIKTNLGDSIQSVYDKSKESLPKEYAEEIENSFLYNQSENQIVNENGNQFKVDFEKGQKTGFFLDQRDNRNFLSQFVKGKKVLNSFCYSGGFSVYALSAGAAMVHSVDVSKHAISLTDENVKLNKLDEKKHESFAEDVLKFLQRTDDIYDVMVVDPPAYAKSLKKRHNAVQGYKRLNALALKKVAPGGVVFTFSCSQVIDRNLFYNTIVAAAIEAKRTVRVLHHLSQPADHPVSLFHPEGAYLKGLVLYVE